MKKLTMIFVSLIGIGISHAQSTDTLQVLEEVVVIGRKKEINLKQAKPLTSIDDYLQQSAAVTMVRRGGYAWEPMVNNMASERTLVTIEGMHIFGACTDKMDPITSYVEVSNLSEATITSGQHGSGYGATIGGSVDLKRNRTQPTEAGWQTMANLGYEVNGNQKIAGASVNYSGATFFADTDVMFRDAANYYAGGNREVAFSQFRKLNTSATAGVRITPRGILEGSVIYDKATDVGYPALPMDVSLAEALITSVRYEWQPVGLVIGSWDSKLYYNQVTHRMDDTGRPDVAIHMDMPGWTKTLGAYTSAAGQRGKNRFKATANGYRNTSKAEMTMYPENPEENPMYMLTWPDVETVYGGLYVENMHDFNCHTALKVSAGAGYHGNTIMSDFGLESIRIFYPEAAASRGRFLKNAAATLYYKKTLDYSLGIGYGERAPSVSEGYGFYLFNSFENFDYVGNPNLKNEKSMEVNASVGFTKNKSKVKLTGKYFRINDYIVGIPEASLLPMTLGATGVKVYTALPWAGIFQMELDAEHPLMENLFWKAQLVYNRGRDHDGGNLPFISPLRYTTSIAYRRQRFSAELALAGNTTQTDYAAVYGEDRTPDYAVLNLSGGYLFHVGANKIHARAGVENLTDAYYSTFTDWNNIPRPGRNFFLNVIFERK